METIQPIRILFVEDIPADAELAERTLRKEGLVFTSARVETQDDFLAALTTFQPDLIVSDYALPEFDGLQALKLSLEHDPALPVILMTGSLNEETAVACIKAGATDYVLKDRIVRLPFAVKEALEQKQTRLAKDAAEQALRDSERRYRLIAENTGDVIWILDLGTMRFRYVSPSVHQLRGYTVEEVMAQDMSHALTPESRAYVQNGLPVRIKDYLEGARELYVDKVAQPRRDGSVVWTEVMTRYLTDEDSGQLIVLGVSRDITERKQAEAALRESEAKFRDMAEQVIDVLFVSDTHGLITYISPSATRVFGWQPAEMIGRNFVEFLSEAEIPRALEQFRAGIEVEQPTQRLELDMKRRDGRLFPGELNGSTLIKAGRAVGTIGLIRDITERKQAEETSRASAANLARSQQIGKLGSWDWNVAGDSLFWSDELYRMWGVGKDFPLTFENIATMIHPADRELNSKRVQELLSVQDEGEFEFRIVCPDGTIKYIYQSIEVTRAPAGQPIRMFGIMQDITERKRAEQNLELLAQAGRELSTTLNLRHIHTTLHRIVQRAMPCDSLFVSNFGTDDQLIRCVYGCGPQGEIDVVAFPPIPLEAEGRGTQSLVIRSGEPLLLNDYVTHVQTANTTYYVTEDGKLEQVIPEEEVPRSALIVPLKLDGQVVGVIQVFSVRKQAYTPRDLQFLESLALHVSTALANARLFAQVKNELAKRQRAEEALRTKAAVLQMLADIDQAIISSLDLDRVLLILLEKVREATQAEACSVALIEPATGDLVFRQAVGGATHEVVGLRLHPGEGLAGWVAQQRQSVLVSDVAADARARSLDNSSGFVTHDLIGVPLIAHEQVTGVIELVNKHSGIFDEDDRRLLESVAAQAAIAIENARLFETEHAGREALETLYRIGQAVNSTLDADTILDRLTDEAMRATHATHGSALIARLDRGCFERRSLRGYSPEQAEKARTDWLPLDRGVNGRAYRTGQAVHIDDVRTDPDYHPHIPETQSELVVPILRGGQVIGNLDLQSPEVDAFRGVRLEFLQALTDQVAIALENARLFAETRRQMEEMSIVSQVALVGAANRPFDEIVTRATNALTQLWPKVPLGFFFVDEAAQVMRPHHSYYGLPPELLATLRIPTSQGIIGWAVRERQPVQVGDVEADPRYLLVTPGTRSEMAAPLLAGQHVIGVINVESPWLNALSGDDLRLLTTLAGQLATLFEKARLDTELIQHAALLEQRVADRTRELSLANDQLKELDRLKDQFVSNVSHELRTPLTSIMLNLDLLDHGKPEKRPHYMDTLRREAERLRKMIEDLLDIARLDRQTAPVELASIDLHQLLGPLVADRATVAIQHGLTLNYLPAAESLLALAEASMLTQVISNLIANALNYTPAGGSVTVQTHQQQVAARDWLTLTVRDTGPGIAAHELPHLFERFYRGEAGRKASAPGTGLGLAISKEIMERLGGRITVESEPGQGTAFTVWLKPG